ncbi:MAG: acylneuraminate cytidylyltransferase [Magnetococcales bacterium]|nr:acylneuraminate cytidylyltransferase [Magnetococcales bacterium]
MSDKIIAIIPARGGSKRVPRKNVLPVGGLPLVAHSILHALHARQVDRVYVSTDSPEIKEITRSLGAEVIERPNTLSGGRATSESALIHVLDERLHRGLAEPELVVFLQCTSPIRKKDDIDEAIETLLQAGADSLFSACLNDRLLWGRGEKGSKPIKSINYNYKDRKRDQDMSIQYRENGSIYVLRPSILRKHNNRLGGKIAVYEMDYWQSFQIDTENHYELMDWILSRPEYAVDPFWPESITLVVFDFDGVMSDNAVMVLEDGREAVRCHRGDGLGIAQIKKRGVNMMVLSTEKNPVVAARCKKLGIPCHQGIGDKATYLLDHLKKENIDKKLVAYLGNDTNDLECMHEVGLPVAVADAHSEVLQVAKLVLSNKGGHGAVREFCDRLSRRI